MSTKYYDLEGRIKIIDKANNGYGNTMNEKLVGTAEQYEADVVKSNYYEYTTKDGELF